MIIARFPVRGRMTTVSISSKEERELHVFGERNGEFYVSTMDRNVAGPFYTVKHAYEVLDTFRANVARARAK